MQRRFRNLIKIKDDRVAIISGFISFFITGGLGWYFNNIDLTRGNMGDIYAYGEIIIYGIFVLAFVIFISATVYQIRYFTKFSTKKTVSSKSGLLGSIGSFFSILVVGCPACSITLASYLGLASIMSLLPYHGLELKILGSLLVTRSAWSTVNKLETCHMKRAFKKDISFICLSCPWNEQKGLLVFFIIIGLGIIVRAIDIFGYMNL